MFLTSLSWLGAVLLLFTNTKVEAQEGCCPKKTVGSVSYTLLMPGTFEGRELPKQCLNDCVYTVSGTVTPMFCFKGGSAKVYYDYD